MNRSRSGLVWFMLFAVLALLAAYLSSRYISAAKTGRKVVVAVQAVQPYQKITKADLKLKSRPNKAIPKDALLSLTKAVGQYTQYGLVPGEMVQSAVLGSHAASPFDKAITAQANIQNNPELRAVPVPFTDKTGYTLVTAGDHVDVVAQIGLKQSHAVETLVQNILVLNRIGPKGKKGSLLGGGGSSQKASGDVVLALTAKDAQRIIAAEALGKVFLTLDPQGAQKATCLLPITGSPGSWGIPTNSASSGKTTHLKTKKGGCLK